MRLIAVVLAFVLCYLVAATNGYTIDMYVSVDDKVKDVYRDYGMEESLIKPKIREDMYYILSSLKDIFTELSKDGIDIELRIIRLDFLEKDILTSQVNGKIVNYQSRNDFINYLNDSNIYDDLKYDLALHFTGYDMVNENGGTIAGSALHKKVCSKQGDSVGVIRFHGTYKPVIFAAHEIGHILGLYHDEKECYEDYIMTDTIYSFFRHKWFFSPCSIRDLRVLLNNQRSLCLTSTSPISTPIDKAQPSKEMLDLDEVCKRQGALYQCRDENTQGDSVCRHVLCHPNDTRTDVCYWGVHSTEGMPCAAGHTCRFGKCLPASGVDPSIKNGCVFGDQKELFVGNVTSCSSDRCDDPNVKNHCCQTCGHGEGGPMTDVRCEDGNHRCKKWQRNGNCVLNHYWMTANCQKSCGTGYCKGSSDEIKNLRGDAKCTKWANDVECIDNQNYMQENCALACQIWNSTEIKNLKGDTNCTKWANEVDCINYPAYMEKNCTMACQIWNSTEIKNLKGYTKCTERANEADCVKHPEYMQENCTLACQVWNSDDCKNLAGDDDCFYWANKGECQKNAKYMNANCQLACGLCTDDCKNVGGHTECTYLAMTGECDSNPSYMEGNCTQACGLCIIDACRNYRGDVKCNGWANSGECEKNPSYMNGNCTLACGICDVCENLHEKCDKWASDGECDKNPDYMTGNCTLACGLCSKENFTTAAPPVTSTPSGCQNKCPIDATQDSQTCDCSCNDQKKRWNKDTNQCDACRNYRGDAKCNGWAKIGECEKNPSYMNGNCTLACGICDVCENLHEECDKWASWGECDKNPDYMTGNCTLACGLCSKENFTTAAPPVTSTPSVCEKLCPLDAIQNSQTCQCNCVDAKKLWNPMNNVCACRTVLNCGASAFNPSTCNCNEECKNLIADAKCKRMVGKGKCLRSPNCMRKKCKLACGFCSIGGSG